MLPFPSYFWDCVSCLCVCSSFPKAHASASRRWETFQRQTGSCHPSTQSHQQLLLLLAHARCFIGPCDSRQVTPSSLALPPLGTPCLYHLHFLSYSLVPVLPPKIFSLPCQDLFMRYLTEPYPITALAPPLPPSPLPRLFPLKGLSPLTTYFMQFEGPSSEILQSKILPNL